MIVAGVLAGVWPCGTVTMLGEMFTAESMTQVYAFLHTFMYENKEALRNLSKYGASFTMLHNHTSLIRR